MAVSNRAMERLSEEEYLPADLRIPYSKLERDFFSLLTSGHVARLASATRLPRAFMSLREPAREVAILQLEAAQRASTAAQSGGGRQLGGDKALQELLSEFRLLRERIAAKQRVVRHVARDFPVIAATTFAKYDSPETRDRLARILARLDEGEEKQLVAVWRRVLLVAANDQLASRLQPGLLTLREDGRRTPELDFGRVLDVLERYAVETTHDRVLQLHVSDNEENAEIVPLDERVFALNDDGAVADLPEDLLDDKIGDGTFPLDTSLTESLTQETSPHHRGQPRNDSEAVSRIRVLLEDLLEGLSTPGADEEEAVRQTVRSLARLVASTRAVDTPDALAEMVVKLLEGPLPTEKPQVWAAIDDVIQADFEETLKAETDPAKRAPLARARRDQQWEGARRANEALKATQEKLAEQVKAEFGGVLSIRGLRNLTTAQYQEIVESRRPRVVVARGVEGAVAVLSPVGTQERPEAAILPSSFNKNSTKYLDAAGSGNVTLIAPETSVGPGPVLALGPPHESSHAYAEENRRWQVTRNL